jgi:hypothetical protein
MIDTPLTLHDRQVILSAAHHVAELSSQPITKDDARLLAHHIALALSVFGSVPADRFLDMAVMSLPDHPAVMDAIETLSVLPDMTPKQVLGLARYFHRYANSTGNFWLDRH